MAASLKQRLTGAAVLLLGAAILWPLIFDDPYSRQVNTHTQIPAEPVFDGAVIEDAKPLYDDMPLETGEFAPLTESPLDGIKPLELADPVPASKPVEPAKPAVKPSSKPAAVAKPVLSSSPSTGMGLDASGLPQRWSVQLASFRDEASALALKNKLVAKGYPAYVTSAQTGSGRFVRVFVGPKLDRASAEALQKEINRDFRVKSIVVKFNP
ncbi:MAG TPA: SPOR domain-containing protein [Pseudomonadales bacterium]